MGDTAVKKVTENINNALPAKSKMLTGDFVLA
jgi:hypothetical protein